MRKILLSSLGVLALAAVALPRGADARAVASGTLAMQTASATVDQGVAAQNESAASRRNRRPRNGGSGSGGGAGQQ